jgi:hypothetical protein
MDIWELTLVTERELTIELTIPDFGDTDLLLFGAGCESVALNLG